MTQSIPDILNRLLNPFDMARYRGNFAPNSRSMHTSFREKISDTFEVISGETTVWDVLRIYDPMLFDDDVRMAVRKQPWYKFNQALPTRPGLFDYATLGIFRGLQLAWSISDELNSKIATIKSPVLRVTAKVLSRITVGFAVPLLHFIGNGILRPAVSAIATLVLLPIIFLSHIISKMILAALWTELSLTKIPQKSTHTRLYDVEKEKGILLPYSPVIALDKRGNEVNVTFETVNQCQHNIANAISEPKTITISSTLWKKVARINTSAREQELRSLYGDTNETNIQMQARQDSIKGFII